MPRHLPHSFLVTSFILKLLYLIGMHISVHTSLSILFVQNHLYVSDVEQLISVVHLLAAHSHHLEMISHPPA